MSAEGESSSKHAVVPTNALETASTVDMHTNKHILNSLNNIDQNNGPDGGPYSLDLQRSQAKWLEKVEKIGQSFVRQ